MDTILFSTFYHNMIIIFFKCKSILTLNLMPTAYFKQTETEVKRNKTKAYGMLCSLIPQVN